MKRIVVLAMLFLAIPVLFFADKSPGAINQDDSQTMIQDLINSKVLLQTNGVWQLKVVSSGLDDKTKQELYDNNRKVGAWAWLNMVVPSLGSWIVGDRQGAVASIVSFSIGVGGMITGYTIFIGGIVAAGASGNSSAIVPLAITGMGILVLGAGTMIVSGFLSVKGTYEFVNRYNTDLKEGLFIKDLSSYNRAYEMQKEFFVIQGSSLKNDLVCFELITFRF